MVVKHLFFAFIFLLVVNGELSADNFCQVCHYRINENGVIQDCGHVFHERCIDLLRQNDISCPGCLLQDRVHLYTCLDEIYAYPSVKTILSRNNELLEQYEQHKKDHGYITRFPQPLLNKIYLIIDEIKQSLPPRLAFVYGSINVNANELSPIITDYNTHKFYKEVVSRSCRLSCCTLFIANSIVSIIFFLVYFFGA